MTCLNHFDFEMPRGMSRTQIAEAFNAYLLGCLVYENEDFGGGRPNGPYQKYEGADISWQLDPSNDFFLSFDDQFPDRARVSCRYDSQRETLGLLLELFKNRYPTRRRIPRAA